MGGGQRRPRSTRHRADSADAFMGCNLMGLGFMGCGFMGLDYGGMGLGEARAALDPHDTVLILQVGL